MRAVGGGGGKLRCACGRWRAPYLGHEEEDEAEAILYESDGGGGEALGSGVGRLDGELVVPKSRIEGG